MQHKQEGTINLITWRIFLYQWNRLFSVLIDLDLCSCIRDVIDLRDDDDDEDEEGEGGASAIRISSSPIRSFTPISEATGCLIDFNKQQRVKKLSQRRRWGWPPDDRRYWLKILETRALTKDITMTKDLFPSSWCQILDIYAGKQIQVEHLNVQSLICIQRKPDDDSFCATKCFLYLRVCWRCFRLPLHVSKHFFFVIVASVSFLTVWFKITAPCLDPPTAHHISTGLSFKYERWTYCLWG